MHQSTSGKSSTIRVMNSSMERAERTDLIPFAITERALGELCAKHNDRAVGLDEAARSAELKSTNKEKVTQIAYAVGSGVGKVISEKAASDLGLPISCGERSRFAPANPLSMPSAALLARKASRFV